MSERARLLLGLAAVALLAAAPSTGLLGAGWISDDAAALGYVHRAGALADWTGTQYDLSSVRFWRPLVTTTLGAQLALHGPDPTWFRAFNLLCHVASALLLVAVARRCRLPLPAALLAGALLAVFPHQGGTVTWIVGRVDSQCLPFLLLAAWGALAGRPAVTVLGTLGAVATKEMGFVAPVWATLLCLGRGDPVADTVRRSGPAWATLAVLLLARRLAIGEWVGGYPRAGEDSLLGAALPAAGALLEALGPLPVVLVVALLAAAVVGRPRLALASLAAGLAASVLLAHVLAPGTLEPEHLRTLLAPEAAFALVVAAAWPAVPERLLPGPRATRAAAAVAFVGVVAIALRAPFAREDVVRWTAAAQLADLRIEAVRDALAGVDPDPRPVLWPGLPRTTDDGRAYVLHWGVADRFRAPFDPTPRPVWPWRRVFDFPGLDRPPVTEERDGLRWLFGETERVVPPLAVDPVDGGEPVDAVTLDARLLGPDRAGPLLVLRDAGEVVALDLVLYTELGLHGARFAGALVPVPADLSPQAILALPVREALLAGGALPLYETLRLASDVGAREAWLEVRAVGDDGAPVAAARPVRLVWGDAFDDALWDG